MYTLKLERVSSMRTINTAEFEGFNDIHKTDEILNEDDRNVTG